MADNTNDTAPEMDATESQTADQSTETVDYKAELDKARKALEAANRESAKRRKQIEAFESQEAERKQASMSELEKAQAALAEAQTRAETAEAARLDALVRAAVIAGASAKGFADTEDALRFLDRTRVEVAADGKVTGVSEQLDALAEAKPYLLATTQTQQGTRIGATNPGRGGGQTGETDAQRRARLYGGGTIDPFSGHGGGVVRIPE